jgi:1,4-alpha-glucan branching enzyme
LNRLYRQEPSLHVLDFDPAGFEWIDCNDSQQGVLSMIRRGRSADEVLAVVCNFTPVPRYDYRIGVPAEGFWRELLNSDAQEYWGSGVGNQGGVMAEPLPFHGRSCSLNLTLPPLAAVFFKRHK